MYIGIDTETGGFRHDYHCLLTIGIVVVDKALRILKRYELKVKANKRYFTKAAFNVNKIDIVEHNKTAISKKKAIEFIEDICTQYGYKGKIKLIGHNIPFDVRFIKHMFTCKKKKFNASHSTIDTQHIWRGLIAMKKVNMSSAHMDDILDYLKIKTIGNRHSALTDIENTIKVLRVIRKNTKAF
jgi:DNA polymerase III epsilon subunit-like protein